jgi:hypothetical protein
MNTPTETKPAISLESRIRRLMPWILLLLFLLLVGLGWSVNLYIGQVAQNKFMISESQRHKKGQQHMEALIEQLKDSAGREHTKVEVLSGTKENLEGLLKIANSDLKRQLDAFGVQLKNLQNSTNLSVTTTGKYNGMVRDSTIALSRHGKNQQGHDTVYVEKKVYKVLDFDENEWFKAKVVVNDDKATIQPTIINQFEMMSYKERRPKQAWWDFFPGKRTVAKIHSLNPYSHVSDYRVIEKEKKRKFLGIF